jgi:hypothetical protein
VSKFAAACLGLCLAVCFTSVRADDLDLGPEPALSSVAWSGDFLLQQDWLRSWQPGGDNESRLLARMRYGPTWQIDDQWSLAGALRIDESTVGNEYLVDYNDNERPRDFALDALHLDYASGTGHHAELGKDELPLTLSRMLWDPDLRPAGVSYAYRGNLGDDTSLRLVAGAFLGQYLSGDQSRFTAYQAGIRFREQESVQPEFILSYLHFTDLDRLVTTGEDRGNPVVFSAPTCSSGPGTCVICPTCVPQSAVVFADRYELLDLQSSLHVVGTVPFRVLLDLDKNLGATNGADRATRFETALGNSFEAGGQEVGYAVERMQQSSVLGAFNDDDWWFHAGSHGSMFWYAYGWSERLRLRAAYFHEQPDGSWHHWNRVLLDLQYRL